MRGTIEIDPQATQEQVIAAIYADEKLAERMTATPKKIVYIPGKIINIII